MPVMESTYKAIRLQNDWLELIEAECKKDGVSFSSFTKMCYAAELKRRKVKLPEQSMPGRPRKAEGE